MKKKICILTAARAEYGLLYPVMEKLCREEEFDIRIAVTGMHLSPDHGMTYGLIEKDGFTIDKKIEILISGDSETAVSKSMGLAMIGFGDYFKESRPDLLLVLGDRYETLAVCLAAMNGRIPIAHLYGGETTEGAVDESIRHAITKLSYLHFTSTEAYRKRVIQLGENPDRVFNVGGLGIENALNRKLLTKEQIKDQLGNWAAGPYAVVTMHPETLEESKGEDQLQPLLQACQSKGDLFYVFTKANADAGGMKMNQMIQEFVSQHKNSVLFDALGSLRYLSLLKHAVMVIGNSSSGLLEAPAFGIPTVNIGDRQKGRLRPETVIDCRGDKKAILEAMNQAESLEFKKKMGGASKLYGDGNTSSKVVEIIKDFVLHETIQLKKKFFDLEEAERIGKQ